MDVLAYKSNAMDWKDSKQSSDFNARSQQSSMLMNTVTTAIKSVGEGMAQAACKS